MLRCGSVRFPFRECCSRHTEKGLRFTVVLFADAAGLPGSLDGALCYLAMADAILLNPSPVACGFGCLSERLWQQRRSFLTCACVACAYIKCMILLISLTPLLYALIFP